MSLSHTAKRSAWSRAGSAASLLAIAGFIALSLWAKWSPAQAQDTPAKKDAPKAKAKKAKTPATPAAQVPGAGQKLDHKALAKIIDQEVSKRLQAEGIKASPVADDAAFLRRVTLDLTGVIPSAEKTEAFLKSTDPHKREKAIDELLADPRFGNYLAEIWAGMMVPRESNNRRLDATPLQKWIATQFNNNVPLNKLVYDLVTASGDQDENGAVTYFIGNPTVDKMTDNVTRMFMGVQLQCAQCHNHPFVDWKQNEYWAMAAFFMKTKLTTNPQQAAKKGIKPGIVEVAGANKGKKGGLPESAKIVPAKFLAGAEPKLDAKEPYRPVLAKWMTANENPFFARAMVNRFWHQLFGRGIVNPVDDMHEENVATHPVMLDALTEQLKANNFDLKHLLRAICNSETYQRSSQPVADNQSDTELYSHRVVRVLGAEQLYDSLVTVLGRGATKKGAEIKTKQPAKGGPNGPREAFLAFFRIDEGNDPLEYQNGIPQALRLMNSGQLNSTNEAVGKAMQAGKEPAQVIENLYIAALSRRPRQEETTRLVTFVGKQADPRTAYGDILWALINSSEFATNH